MLQDMFRSLPTNVRAVKEKVQKQLNQGFGAAEQEGKKVLRQLGADVDKDKLKIAEVVAQIREHNDSVRTLAHNIDTATYDLRGRLAWNATMMSAYAKLKAEQTIEKQVRPKVKAYKGYVENKFKNLTQKPERI